MSLGAFSTETVYMHASMDGCIQVAAKPLIKIYRIPRDFADSLVNEPDLKQAGIYLLINREENTLYVGQADARDNGYGVLNRMLEPHTKKTEIDQWDVGYALISGTPQFFGATELNYLERFFYDKAAEVGKYELLNGIKPHTSSIGMATQLTLQSYTDHAFFLLENVVGCDVFVTKKRTKGKKTIVAADGMEQTGTASVSTEQVTDAATKTDPEQAGTASAGTEQTANAGAGTEQHTVTTSTNNGQPLNHEGLHLFIDNTNKDAHAEGILLKGKKLLALKGSTISTSSSLMNQKSMRGVGLLRQRLIDDGMIIDRVFVTDYEFSSPSTAASVILGTSSSGNAKWKDANGTPLGSLLGATSKAEIKVETESD